MSAEKVHLTVAEARTLGESALRGIGYDAEEARIIADHVIDAALCGYEYSGLAKILNIPEHRRFLEPKRPMRILHETPVSALYDGGNNVGMLAMYHAANAAIAKAATHGISVIGVTDSWMSGRSAYFVEMIAKAGLVAIHTASSGGAVAPHGGSQPVLGTNPIAFAFPGEDGPLVLDTRPPGLFGATHPLAIRSLLLSVDENPAGKENVKLDDLFIHSTRLVLLDRRGRLRAYFNGDGTHPRADIATAVNTLLEEH